MGNPISITLDPGESYNFPAGIAGFTVRNDSNTQPGKIEVVFSNGDEWGRVIAVGATARGPSPGNRTFTATNSGTTQLFIKTQSRSRSGVGRQKMSNAAS
jgi:hypothetical protein